MPLFTHVRCLNPPSTQTQFILFKTPTSHILILPFSHTYKILDCQRLSVLFHGPITESFQSISFSRNTLILSNLAHLYFYQRSILLKTYNIKAEHVLYFSNYLIIKLDNLISFYEIKDEIELEFLHSFECEKLISIYCLPTYMNKILICTEHNIQIYNFIHNKLLYQSDKIKLCSLVEPSPVLNVIAMVTVNCIYLYNVKKDKILFSIPISGNVKRMSFHTNNRPLLLVLTNGNLNLYHMEEQRLLTTLECNVEDAAFLEGEDVICIRKSDLIKLVVLENYKIRLLKQRILFGHVYNLEEINNDLILSTEYGMYNANLHIDELNYKFKIKNYSKPEFIKVGIEHVVTANTKHIQLLSRENKNSEVIMESYKDSFIDIEITTCGNFGVVRTENNIIVHNLKSKLLYRKYEIESGALGMAFDIFMKRIIVCYENRMLLVNDRYESEVIYFDVMAKGFKYVNGFCLLKCEDCVALYDLKLKQITRMFLAEGVRGFSVSGNFALIAIISMGVIKVFDIRTQKNIENISLNGEVAKVFFTTDNKYLCVLCDGRVDLYFNNAIFSAELRILGFDKDCKENIIFEGSLCEKLERNFISVQRELNQMLISEECDIKVREMFENQYLKWDVEYEKTVSYIEYENKNIT